MAGRGTRASRECLLGTAGTRRAPLRGFCAATWLECSDDDEQRKYKLIVAALKKLCGGANTPIPEGMQVAVWVVRTPAASNQKGCVARVWRPLA